MDLRESSDRPNLAGLPTGISSAAHFGGVISQIGRGDLQVQNVAFRQGEGRVVRAHGWVVGQGKGRGQGGRHGERERAGNWGYRPVFVRDRGWETRTAFVGRVKELGI
jgi:hypothetical protein